MECIKLKNVTNWLSRNCEDVELNDVFSGKPTFYGRYNGYRIRTVDESIQIGCSDFDRWANSVAVTIPIDVSKSIPKQINTAMYSVMTTSYPDAYERSFNLMCKLADEVSY